MATPAMAPPAAPAEMSLDESGAAEERAMVDGRVETVAFPAKAVVDGAKSVVGVRMTVTDGLKASPELPATLLLGTGALEATADVAVDGRVAPGGLVFDGEVLLESLKVWPLGAPRLVACETDVVEIIVVVVAMFSDRGDFCKKEQCV